MAHDDLLEIARERKMLAEEAEAEQREQEREDLRFQVPELQWTAEAKAQRLGDGISSPRPMLSITQLDAPARLIRNQARAAKLGVNVHPVSEKADEDTAEVIQGLYRRIERDSNANVARMWALDRAVKAGRGYYRILTAYDEDAPEGSDDQEIRIVRILHQDSVLLDPSATEPDWSDGKWAFVLVWMPRQDFREKYPAARLSTADSLTWEAAATVAPKWVRGDGREGSAILVAEYWYKTITHEPVKSSTRKREVVKVHMVEMTGAEVLGEPQLWPGRYIPIVPVIGSELQPFDERRRFQGMVTNAKDGQRMFNYAASTLVEAMSAEPKVPWVGAEGQFEGHEEKWNQANVKNYAYLEYKPTSHEGNLTPPPQRSQVDGSRMQLSMMAMKEAGSMVQQSTAVHDPSLGRIEPQQRSGRAILALQQQGDMSTGDFLSNLAEVSMTYEAKVVLDLLPHIYDRAGRITRILRGDDQKAEAVALNAPFQAGDGAPQVLDEGAEVPPGAKSYNLTEGARYGVNIEVGRSYRSRLQEGSEALTRIIEARPDLMEIIGDLYFTFQDFPGGSEIAKRLTKIREQKYPGLGEGEDGKMTPEQMAARAQMAEQKIQELGGQLQAALQALQTEQAKQQATVEKARMDQETKLATTRMETESREAQVAEQEETKRLVAGLKVELEAVKSLIASRQAEQQQQATAQEAREGRAHEVGMAAGQPAQPRPMGGE